jgi:hypothetical protein
MRGLRIDRSRSGYFTSFKEIISALSGIKSSYNWLLTSYECNVYPKDFISPDDNYLWLTAEDFNRIATMTSDIQLIWGVLSAFPESITLDEVLDSPLPIAEGNAAIWGRKLIIQHPLAVLELVSWDSSELLVTAKDEKLLRSFLVDYPDAIDLDSYKASL